MEKLNAWDWIGLILIIIGALNWGLVGIFNYNLVDAIFGQLTFWSRTIYILVAISAIYIAYESMRIVKRADKS